MRRRVVLAAVAGFASTLAAFAPPASAEPAVSITPRAPQQLVRFDTATPGTATQTPITGLRQQELLRGLDYRPATGEVYGTSSRGSLYIVDVVSGVATRTSELGIPGGFRYGVDFNPVVDRLRLVNQNDNSFRVNVDTGEVVVDGTLAYAGGDDNAGANPQVTGSAYSNNFAGAGATVLYGLDAGLNTLVTQAPPNDGTLNTIGGLGVPFTPDNGFDISGATGVAFAALTRGGSGNLYRVDLGTGAATLVGPIGAGGPVGGLTILPAAPEPPADAT